MVIKGLICKYIMNKNFKIQYKSCIKGNLFINVTYVAEQWTSLYNISNCQFQKNLTLSYQKNH